MGYVRPLATDYHTTMDDRGNLSFELVDNVDGVMVSASRVPLVLLKEFAKDVGQFIVGSDPDIKASDISVSIETGSLVLRTSDPPPATLSVWLDIERLRGRSGFGRIDPKRWAVVDRWQKAARLHPSRRIRVIESISTEPVIFDAASDYVIDESPVWFETEKYLEGTIVDMGGKKPNIHIQLDSGQLLTIDADRELIARERENHVYHAVVLRIKAEQNLVTGELRGAKLLDFWGYAPKLDEAQNQEMIRKGTAAWSDVSDHVEWVRRVRGECS